MNQQHGQGTGSLANVFNILEQQGQLLRSLQGTLSRTDESLVSEEHKSSSQELFTAILTSQHAILSKFDEVASIRLSSTDDLHAAIAALHNAEDAANARTRKTEEQSREIGALKIKVEEATACDVKLRAEVDELKQRLRDTRQERDELCSSLEEKENRLKDAMREKMRADEETGRLVTRALAAELEKDVLARSLVELREERKDAEREREQVRREVR